MNDPVGASLSTALVGADSLLIECGETLLSGGHRIHVVAAGSDRVATWAHGHGLTVIDASGAAAEWGPALAEHDFDWLFAITHLALLPDHVIDLPRRGAINFHDGPLPQYGGLNTPAWALINGETSYGISWHEITPGIDEGPVYKEANFEIAEGETSLSLNTRNFEAAIDSFRELVDELVAGTAVAVAQPTDVERRTFSRLDRPDNMAVLDWQRPATTLDQLVRALSFGPYPNPLGIPKVRGQGDVVLVTACAVADGEAGAAPGTVLHIDDDAIVVACAADALALTECSTLDGVSLTIAEAAAALGVAVGASLAPADQVLPASVVSRADHLAKSERHHLRQLESLVPAELPWARTAPDGHTPRPATREITVPDPLGADGGAPIAALAVLLARVTGNTRLHVALADGSWPSSDDARFFVPTVPLEVRADEDATLEATVQNVGDLVGAARDRGPYLRELLVRHPDLVEPHLAVGVRTADSPSIVGAVLELVDDGGSWSIVVDEAVVDPAEAGVIAGCLDSVLAAMASTPGSTVAEVDLLGESLRARVLESWNDTETPVRADVCVHQLVEEQADRTPDETAVIFEDDRLSYRDLDERANRLANHLIGLGIGPDAFVGIHVPRGIDLIVAVVGVHKAGGAYVPLDPDYPADRLDHMIADSGCRVVLTTSDLEAALPRADDPSITVVRVDGDRAEIDRSPATRPAVAVSPDDLAYCIYTSGSTGVPKGVLVQHGNVVNFFVGMDDHVDHELPATWFAVTSLSFDISVLELLYTLTRGFTVVVHLDRDRAGDDEPALAHAQKPMDFSLFYFSGDASEGDGADKYRLLLDGARFADSHGFAAVWTPERHFHAFGGLYPQPAVTGAAVAAITENVDIRAGSVVMPLHHPVRVAEAWSVVDNISNGRVGISVASGWQPNDFVLMPDNFANAKQAMFDGVEVVKQLWRGETVAFDGPTGSVDVVTLPRPVQPELPVWVTSAGNPETYIQAGRIGANVLTHLLGQSIEQLAPKIEAYRQARAEAGFDPDEGHVTLMLHTFVGEDEDLVREIVREPLKAYLGESFSLLREYAWSFPAFQRPGDDGSTKERTADDLGDEDFKSLSDEDLDAVLEFAFERYFATSGLFGSSQRCQTMVDELKGIGVDEVACLIDFGVDTDVVLESLDDLDRIREQCNPAGDAVADPGADLDQSVAAQLRRHEVTHLQCTPSMARMFILDDDTRAAVAGVEHVFVGGEAFPVALAQELRQNSASGNVTNMYGPTETTIWSTTWALEGELDSVPIGSPIANTRIYLLDGNRRPVPPGVAGELWIGGLGVVRGYHERPELTAERFVADPFCGGDHRMYFTGDLARWRMRDDGSALLEFGGRLDHQVKLRGYRIELGEIEARLSRYPGVRECLVTVSEDASGEQVLLAFASASDGATIEAAPVKEHLRETLPDVMVPAHLVALDDLPHTPNGKLDRGALPSLADVLARPTSTAPAAEAGSDLERTVLAVWEDTLGFTGIGVDDNFFDIGGHSLLIVRMHRRFKDELDPTIALTDLYRHPTVRGFAAALSEDTSAETRQSSVDRAARRKGNLARRRARR